VRRVYNYVRCVRDHTDTPAVGGGSAEVSLTPSYLLLLR
jgi:hypothetical protein